MTWVYFKFEILKARPYSLNPIFPTVPRGVSLDTYIFNQNFFQPAEPNDEANNNDNNNRADPNNDDEEPGARPAPERMSEEVAQAVRELREELAQLRAEVTEVKNALKTKKVWLQGWL